ncbi:hypothetical protein OG735_01605 [Streptomyces sp. NBC_01210]|uniref:hypothetical protein n=1 Tax=Streptomyces sp. NBC_01210 TaxID=2903774 RepID=UPI002E0F2C40|nr:hypothetical protein OG735_01605 [Streptomyces sp. NBC_01210]
MSESSSDSLIQAGLDALVAGVHSPSLATLAGLLRSEEPEAPELSTTSWTNWDCSFTRRMYPRAAKWAMAYWIAISDVALFTRTGSGSTSVARAR